MSDVDDLLRRQAEWQEARKELPWPEKIRMAAAVRDAVRKFSAEGSQNKGRCADSASDPAAKSESG